VTEQAPILATQELRIEILSALHIGTGEQLGQKDYARQGQQVFVAKPEKLLSLVQRSSTLERDFLAFCEDGRQSLTEFLRQQRIRFEDVAGYSVTATGQPGRIPTFIKNVEGRPYVPGSSVKGAVRSSLLRSRVVADKAVSSAAEKAVGEDLDQIRRQPHPNLSYWRKRIGGDAERTFFGKDEHHDFMRCFQFADSTPREVRELRVPEVRVLSLGANGHLYFARDPRRSDREMRPLTPEVLPRSVELVCPLTINLYLLSSMPPATRLGFGQKTEFVKAWLAECNRAAHDLIQQEIEFFERHPFNGRNKMVEWYEDLRGRLGKFVTSGNQCLLHMAGASGWDAKTITDRLEDGLFNDVRSTLRLNVGRPHVTEHGRAVWSNSLLPKDDSPKSRKIIFENGEPKEPLGWVQITAKDVSR